MSSPPLQNTARATSAALDRSALEAYFQEVLEAISVVIVRHEKLSGGAIQENWALELNVQGGTYAGQRTWVLRSDAKSSVQQSLTRSQEFAVINQAYRSGVKVPRPLWLCESLDIIGRPFFIMEKAAGRASGQTLTSQVGANGSAELATSLGANLARLHRIAPPLAELAFLAAPQDSSVAARIIETRAYLDTLNQAHPVIEWGLRWCELNLPPGRVVCLLHGDYRTGNYMVEGSSLEAVLDWEFTEWGNPLQDVGWFTARCWRFARPDLIAGGIGKLEDFLRGYNTVSPLQFDEDELIFWQVFATIRWAVIALQQSERHVSGVEPSLELALTGRLVPELEQDILQLTGGLRS